METSRLNRLLYSNSKKEPPNRHTFDLANWPNGKALDYESRDCRFDVSIGSHTNVPAYVLTA